MKQSPEWPGLEAMAHTLLYDGAITEDEALWNERAGQVSVPSLVLFSAGTSAYLGDSARRAADSIPNAVSRTLPGQFHDVGPETLAAELGAFLCQCAHDDESGRGGTSSGSGDRFQGQRRLRGSRTGTGPVCNVVASGYGAASPRLHEHRHACVKVGGTYDLGPLESDLRTQIGSTAEAGGGT